MNAPEKLAADHIRELTQRHHVTSKIRRDNGTTELHTVTAPPLLDQLGHAAQISGLSNESAATRADSKPPVHLEALDLLARIDHQSADLADEHGIDEPQLTKRLHRLSGFIGHAPHRRVRSWWTAARVVTHWDAPAHRPYGAPCPQCWDTGTLRIRLDEEIAHCTGCGSTWDHDGSDDSVPLEILAQHVRWCTDHDVTKPKHWRLDANGFPIECTECLDWREAWFQWRAEQQHATEKMGA